MPRELVPHALWDDLGRLPSIFEENWLTTNFRSGLQVSEDDSHVFVEAQLPGLESDQIEVSYHKGILSVSGEAEETEADKKRKHYRRFQRSFSYQVAVPGAIDEQEPKATFRNGVMRVTFQKRAADQPKRIPVKRE